MSEDCDVTVKYTDLDGRYIAMAEALRLRWRVGTKVRRTVYATKTIRNTGEVDRLIGMFDTPDLAEQAVRQHNAAIDELWRLTDAAYPAAFQLNRVKDVSNVSGTGVVATGYYWGKHELAIIQWKGPWPSWNIHLRGIEAVEHVHGHGGLTTIEWGEAPVYAIPDQVAELFAAAMRLKALDA